MDGQGCARPGAQQLLINDRCKFFSRAVRKGTLLRPRTGTLRGFRASQFEMGGSCFTSMDNTRTSCLALLFAFAFATANAADLIEIPLWPNGAPGSEGKTEKEIVTTSAGGDQSVRSIHNPSITPYLPVKEKATGTAMLVIPGGGHRVLAITHEGYNVGEWLKEHGIAAFVLKHRLARETNSTYKIEVEAFADNATRIWSAVFSALVG